MSHSPLGASGSHRWIVCPGSTSLSEGIQDAESEYAAVGTAAHALGAYCLGTGSEPWEHIGVRFAEVDGREMFWPPGVDGAPETAIGVDKDMADAVQVYVNWVRSEFPDRNQGNTFIERDFKCPSIHPLFWGTSDFNHLILSDRTLHIADYKHGAGIVVEVENNPQLKYYACGVLEDLNLWQEIDRIVMTIVQPNGFHSDGPIRTWEISVDDLAHWLESELIPAMKRADPSNPEGSRDTIAGEHCRFCPARGFACPGIFNAFAVMEELNEMAKARALTNEELGKYLEAFEVAKIAHKQHSEQAFTMLSAGKPVPGFKLVAKKVNRTWKEGAEEAVKAQFGEDALTLPELKSPAEIDKLPLGKKITTRWAEKPVAGYTIARVEDARREVSSTTKSLFTPVGRAA